MTAINNLGPDTEQGLTAATNDISAELSNPSSLFTGLVSGGGGSATALLPSLTDIVTALTAATSSAYSILLPTADIATALAVDAHRYNAPFVAVVLNNHSYWASKLPVMELYPDGSSLRANDFPETQLTPETDYAAPANACGGAGRTVHTPQDVKDALRWALAEADQGRCAVLDVRLPQP